MTLRPIVCLCGNSTRHALRMRCFSTPPSTRVARASDGPHHTKPLCAFPVSRTDLLLLVGPCDSGDDGCPRGDALPPREPVRRWPILAVMAAPRCDIMEAAAEGTRLLSRDLSRVAEREPPLPCDAERETPGTARRVAPWAKFLALWESSRATSETSWETKFTADDVDAITADGRRETFGMGGSLGA